MKIPVDRIQKGPVRSQIALHIRQLHFQLREIQFERKYHTISKRDRNRLRATFIVQYFLSIL
jgi:hypothetical protein